MCKLKDLTPNRVFHYFEEISAIPRGSGDMEKIADYCENFAISHSLRYNRDNANNVIIYKSATEGYENSKPVILQGHLDMVCQKKENISKDFSSEGIDIIVDGDYIKANGTTLGADNGIAVAMVLAILESNDIPHPPIEAVFTTDEETGMIGAGKLDFSILKSNRMINLDSEEEDVLTVSCAGGSDFRAVLQTKRIKAEGYKATLILKGLKGGHSGVEIDKGRVNADILAGRILDKLKECCDFSVIGIYGGDKPNVIPNFCKIELCTDNQTLLVSKAEEYLDIIREEIKEREKEFCYDIISSDFGAYEVLDKNSENSLIFALNCVPNSIMEMSAEIEGLVETSLNLGILKTDETESVFHHALRSNKRSALEALENKLKRFYSGGGFQIDTFGHYPPWEFKENSYLQNLYTKIYRKTTGKDIKVEAIHAGLECGVFASGIKDFDCIAIGPQLFDVHTVNEKLSISSTKLVYELLLKTLKEIK